MNYIGSDSFTLAEIRELVTEDETFFIYPKEDSMSQGFELSVRGYRLETPEELEARVKKEETYMENYRKFHGIE